MYSRLQISEPSPYVLHVQLNRPNKRNALDRPAFTELLDCFNRLHSDRHFRTAVISGAGNVFCAGIDLFTLQSASPTHTEDVGRKAMSLNETIEYLQKCVAVISMCRKPVIAAVQGACVGAGLNLIGYTDIRYCTQDAYFSLREIDVGLAADLGGLYTLPRCINNASLTREMVFTGKSIDGKEAERYGLVSAVLPDSETLLQESLKLAQQIASRSPIAVQSAKTMMDHQRSIELKETLQFAAAWNMSMLQSEDLLKAAAAAITKSNVPPEFDDL